LDYDIFISYSSADRAWAEKLNTELTKRGLKIFLDTKRLTAGDEWEDQLKSALNNSTHMIFLWSLNARNSDWVNKEAAYFSIAVTGTTRKSIPVILNDSPKAYSSTQAITDITANNFYDAGIATVPQHTWDTITSKIYDSISLADDRIPIRLLVLTLTRAELAQLNFDHKPLFGKTLNELLPAAMYDSTTILNLYGAKKTDWKPFGGQMNVKEILDNILQETNEKRELNYKWVAIDEEKFWSNNADEFNSQINILKKELSVIILDPIALYNDNVKDRFELMLDCLANKDLLIMTFPSFEPSQPFCSWRELIKSTSKKFYSSYFKPDIPKSMNAQFTANPLDKKDARRFIQQIISSSAHISTKSKNPYFTT
jgi:hypothetical protein